MVSDMLSNNYITELVISLCVNAKGMRECRVCVTPEIAVPETTTAQKGSCRSYQALREYVTAAGTVNSHSGQPNYLSANSWLNVASEPDFWKTTTREYVCT